LLIVSKISDQIIFNLLGRFAETPIVACAPPARFRSGRQKNVYPHRGAPMIDDENKHASLLSSQ
jgi:hypothetical protein